MSVSLRWNENESLLSESNNSNIISYNILNLPETISVMGKGTITYLHDASGTKLSKTANETGQPQKVTTCLDGLIFENDVLQHIAMEEGRIRPNGSSFVYDYFLKDHLGNVRMMIDESGNLLEETHYYPFGLSMSGISTKNATPSLQNKDKTFQGQKFDDDLGLNYYSFKYRNHDPQIGRFTEIDPLANDYVYNSTYAFSENKVTAHVELEGLETVSATQQRQPKTIVLPQVKAPGFWGGVLSLVNIADDVRERLIDIMEHPENYPNHPLAQAIIKKRDEKQIELVKQELDKPLVMPEDAVLKGVIYEVPGEHTKSGKPYVGRTKHDNPAKRRSDGGRDRKKAKVVDKYDSNNPREGREKEQGKIDEKGLKNLDNKRNEIKPKKNQ